MVHRRGTWFDRLVGETRREIPQGWARLLHRWYWFWQIGSGKLRGFSMVNMASIFHFTIFVNHLILVGYVTQTIGSFPSRRQFGVTFWRYGERKDQATDLIGVGGRRGWRDGHLLVGKLEPLSNGLYVLSGVLGGWRGAGVRSEVRRKYWFATCSDNRGRESVGFMGHGAEGKHYPWGLVYPGFGGGSLKQASAEHVIQGPVAPPVDGVAFRVIR